MYSISVHGVKSNNGPFPLGISLALTAASATPNVASCTNPIARIVHPNPTVGSIVRAILGKINPPAALPDAASTSATPRRREKYVVTTAMTGVNSKPLPSPVHTPCARNTCQ